MANPTKSTDLFQRRPRPERSLNIRFQTVRGTKWRRKHPRTSLSLNLGSFCCEATALTTKPLFCQHVSYSFKTVAFKAVGTPSRNAWFITVQIYKRFWWSLYCSRKQHRSKKQERNVKREKNMWTLSSPSSRMMQLLFLRRAEIVFPLRSESALHGYFGVMATTGGFWVTQLSWPESPFGARRIWETWLLRPNTLTSWDRNPKAWPGERLENYSA